MNRSDYNDLALRYQRQRITDRQIDELVGICKGTIVDGSISKGEADYLLHWLEANRMCADTWPANVLYPRIAEMLKDGILDAIEEKELLETLTQLAGGRPTIEGNASTTLPLDEPPPSIVFPQRSFCVTGTFSFGARARVHAVIEDAGGEIAKGIRKDLDYLVIGSIGTESWKHSSFGLKIKKAMEYKQQGAPLAIIGEAHWLMAVMPETT